MALQATTDFTSSQINPSLFHYGIKLNNAGDTTIGTFWFAWDDFPDQNFMPTSPSQITSPAGWNPSITHNGPTDGFGILWIASSPAARLPAGGSLEGFSFQSATAPATMAGKSPIDTDFDTTFSFVYSAGPFSDPGFTFTSATAPGGPVGLHAIAVYTITPAFAPPEEPGTLHDYNITLHNDGTTTIGTFWFAWNDVPDENYMTVQPQLLTPPTGWNAIVTHNGPSDGFGIEWVASTPAARLAPGDSLAGFSFRSTMDVLLFAGISPIGAGVPTTSSVLYEGLPLSGPGFDLNPTAPDGIPCFRQGTRLRTPFGWCAVEDLAIGDAITLRDSTTAPVKWLGWRSIDCQRHPRPRSVWPVRVARHAFGPGRPARDLFLSPDHAVFAAGRLVPAHLLVNGATITQEPTDSVTYWHVELPSHAIVSAEGLATESYLDTGNRAAFANAPDAVMMHPDFSRGIWELKGCAPLLLEGPALSSLRSRLLARAERLGHVMTDDPDLRVLVDGAPARLFVATQRVIVSLPLGARQIQLRSRTWSPAETTAAGQDPRRLGVAIANPRFDLNPAAIDDPRLTTGWHLREGDLRWTDGDATIQAQGARRFDFDLAMIGRYWKATDRRTRVA